MAISVELPTHSPAFQVRWVNFFFGISNVSTPKVSCTEHLKFWKSEYDVAPSVAVTMRVVLCIMCYPTYHVCRIHMVYTITAWNQANITSNIFISKIRYLKMLKLAIHLSFIAFRHVRALFCELFREIANQSLYTSHNIADFIHLWFCEKLDEKLSLSPLWRFVKIPTVWRERQNARWEKWLARWFMKCHLYTYRFSHFANIFSHSRQFDNNCIVFRIYLSAVNIKFQ